MFDVGCQQKDESNDNKILSCSKMSFHVKWLQQQLLSVR